MTTPIATSTTDSQMHNNIMAAGSRDRPPMLATGRYAQWRSRFLRYIDTRPNGDALRKCILTGPYIPTMVTTPAVPATEDSPEVPAKTSVETVLNMTPENKAHYESEKEAIHLILTGIGDEIYSTVDACQTAQEMWEAIERLQQGESLNIQDVKTNLFWEFGQFTSHDGETIESYYTRFYKMMNEMIRNNLTVATMQVNVQFLQQLQPEWSRFVTIVKQQHKLDEVSYHKLFDILKQYQKEVNELRAERMAKNANPLALVATAQTLQDPYYQSSKPHKSYAPTSKASLPTRSHATTRYKGKEIAKPITPPSESASEEDSDPEQAQKDKDMQKNLALIAKYFKKLYKPTNNNLRTSSNTRNKNVDTTPRYKNDNQTGQFGNQRAINVVGARETVGGQVVQQSGIQCFNCKEFGHYAKECRKPKRVRDSTYHKEKMLMCKQAEKGVQLQAEQSDWLADTDEEIDEQELEAHYSYMAKIQEVPNADSGTDAEPLEQVHYDTDHNVFANDLQHFEQSESIRNTYAVETGDSNVIPDSPDMCDNERAALANLIANLKLDVDDNKKIQTQLKKANATLTQELTECKSILAETSRTLGESNSIRDSCLVTLQNKHTEFERYKAFNDRTVDYDKLERQLNETLGLLAQKDIDIQEGLKVKAYEISIVKEKHDELVKQSLLTKSHYEGLVKEKTKVITKLKEEKDIDKMISMENQLKFLNGIVYKRSQSIQTIHMLAPKCPTFNGRPTFANPINLKKAQKYEILCSYAILHDQSDPTNRLVPDREETLTLDNESRSKLNKDLVKPFDYTKLNSLYEIQFAQANEIRKKMWRKSFVKTKPNIVKNIDFLPVSKSISKSRQSYNVMTNNINHLKEIINQAWVKHSNDLLHLRNPTAQDMEILVKIYLKYVESLEDELDELKSDKAEFSNMYDMLLQECMSKDVICSYLQSSSDLDEITKLQCLYLHKVKECDCSCKKLSEQTNFIPFVMYTSSSVSSLAMTTHPILVDFGLPKAHDGNLSLIVPWNIMIKRVYYVEGLNHNLFSVGQFCDADLEVAFRKSTCFVRDLQGNDLLTGNRGTDLYTISLQEITSSLQSVSG
ncbi:retrovirus-related pol polyprotein from transposon TNT 1-94 [Tanacetum coccineum]